MLPSPATTVTHGSCAPPNVQGSVQTAAEARVVVTLSRVVVVGAVRDVVASVVRGGGGGANVISVQSHCLGHRPSNSSSG